MRLQRHRDQGAETLDEAFAVWAKRGRASGTNGRAMLALLEGLRASDDDRTAWGVTSLAQLCLLSRNAVSCPWYVKITAPSHGGYQVEYLMPEALAPWPNAYVQGRASTVAEAVDLIAIAMNRSQGWPRRAPARAPARKRVRR